MEYQVKLINQALHRKYGAMDLLIPISSNFSSSAFTIELNETGVELWKIIDAEKAILSSKLIEFLCFEYEIPQDVASGDCYAFLEQLRELSIVSLEEFQH